MASVTQIKQDVLYAYLNYFMELEILTMDKHDIFTVISSIIDIRSYKNSEGNTIYYKQVSVVSL